MKNVLFMSLSDGSVADKMDEDREALFDKYIKTAFQYWINDRLIQATRLLIRAKDFNEEKYFRIMIKDDYQGDSKLMNHKVGIGELLVLASARTTIKENEKNRRDWFEDWARIDKKTAEKYFWRYIVPSLQDRNELKFYIGYYVHNVFMQGDAASGTPQSIFRQSDRLVNLVFEQINDEVKRASLLLVIAMTLSNQADPRCLDLAFMIFDYCESSPEYWALSCVLAKKSNTVELLDALTSAIERYLRKQSRDPATFLRERIHRFFIKFENTIKINPICWALSFSVFLRDDDKSNMNEPLLLPEISSLLKEIEESKDSTDMEVLRELISKVQMIEDSMGAHIDLEIHDEAIMLLEQFGDRRGGSIRPAKDVSVIREMLAELTDKKLQLLMDENGAFFDRVFQERKKLVSWDWNESSISKETKNILANEITEIMRFPEAGRLLITAEGLWNLLSQSGSPGQADAIDYTFAVASYFKTVETYLHSKLGEICKGEQMVFETDTNDGKKLPIVIGVDESWNKVTLGQMSHFVRKHASLTMRTGNLREIAQLNKSMKNWIDNIRNANFHRDIIDSWSLASNVRHESIVLLKRLATSLKEN